jgi:glycerol uptake facilitator-like aquaporin
MIGAPISGGHYNPNLSLSFHLAGDRTAPNLTKYQVMILGGAFAAQALAHLLTGTAGPSLMSATTAAGWAKICAGEFLGSFLSVMVVMYVALISGPLGGIAAPVLVGLGFFASIATFSGLSGSALNPAVAFGFYAVGRLTNAPKSQLTALFYYVAAELAGAALAGLATLKIRERLGAIKKA